MLNVPFYTNKINIKYLANKININYGIFITQKMKRRERMKNKDKRKTSSSLFPPIKSLPKSITSFFSKWFKLKPESWQGRLNDLHSSKTNIYTTWSPLQPLCVIDK